MSSKPIGIFDSGLGGASVLRVALEHLPRENYIYYGDNRNAPYGDRTEQEITDFTFEAARKLVEFGVKAIVIACNTATATCVRQIRSELDVPVISIEPAIRPACMAPGNGKILMMATTATTRLGRYLALQARMPDPARVINIPCSGQLVRRIEDGCFHVDGFDDLFDEYLSPYGGLEVDGIVLGCTHYIFIKEAFLRNAGRLLHPGVGFRLYDGNEGTVRQLKQVLREKRILNPEGTARVEFHTSGDGVKLQPIFDRLIQRQGV